MAKWNIDPAHTGINFSVRHMMVTTVRGSFQNFNGTIEFDPANPTAGSVEVTIDANSINTGASDRDNHLRSADFFDVANHPNITFKSTKVEVKGDNTGKIYGDLTIHGVTRPVVLDTEFLGENTNPWGAKVIGFNATTKINREDFGLTWNVALETGGVLVGKEIKIELDVEAALVVESVAANA
ncbi:MAG: polyisoprenoid-binding protein [Chloroflexi bacterium]|nr:polyisoprenoid-binding protein [Chloroflexota bacterium]NOG62091.1 polyisoprenoid-binding protein [Chloroflexota bacterium]